VKKNDGSLLIISSHLPLIPPQGGKNSLLPRGRIKEGEKNDGSLLIISSHLPLIPPQGGKKFAPPLREDKGG